MIKKVVKAIGQIVVGVIKGGGETTLIPSIIRELKKFKQTGGLIKLLDTNGDGKINTDDFKGLTGYLDVNGDGQFNLKDVQDLKWETLGKLLGLVAAMCTLLYFVSRFAPGLLTLL